MRRPQQPAPAQGGLDEPVAATSPTCTARGAEVLAELGAEAMTRRDWHPWAPGWSTVGIRRSEGLVPAYEDHLPAHGFRATLSEIGCASAPARTLTAPRADALGPAGILPLAVVGSGDRRPVGGPGGSP